MSTDVFGILFHFDANFQGLILILRFLCKCLIINIYFCAICAELFLYGTKKITACKKLFSRVVVNISFSVKSCIYAKKSFAGTKLTIAVCMCKFT